MSFYRFVLLFMLLRQNEAKSFSSGFDDTEVAMDRITKTNTELGVDLYEGDIKLSMEDYDVVDLSEDGDVDGKNVDEVRKRNAQRQREKLWHERIIPYEISSEMSSDAPIIQSAFDEYHAKTCLQFTPRTTEQNWIKFVKKQGCWSYIGRLKVYGQSGTGQELSLGNNCYTTGIIVHELMHAIGFYHEQSRADRNKFVRVLWENIEEAESHNFNKYSRSVLDDLGVKYDYESIMHYGKSDFSKNGAPTIEVIGNSSATIGQRNGLSTSDVIKINALYNCHLNASGWSEWSSYSPCSSDCFKERQRYCFSSDTAQCPGVSQYGIKTEKTTCDDQECYAPVNGHWGRWSSWSRCSSSCGSGTKYRSRTCDDPAPKYGGQQCPAGEDQEHDQCYLGACIKGLDDCEFDLGDTCHWMRSGNSPGYQWSAHNGHTPSTGTGPIGDHTTGAGYYIYTEASYPATTGSTALLTSKVFSQCRCMKWSYYMYGKTVADLSVYVQPVGQQQGRRVWEKNGSQGPQWITEEITVSAGSTTQYTVQFESVRGQSYSSDIALDDIYFKKQPCGVQPLGCYGDRGAARALPNYFANLRNKIDWYDMQKTVNECACLAFEQGYKYFGVQYYGECWGSKTDVNYAKYGPGQCIDGVGKDWSNYVYTFQN